MKLFSNMNVEQVAFVGEPAISRSLDKNSKGHYYICVGSIFANQEFFTKAVSHLLTATKDDTVTILINSPGGCVESLKSLIGAMRLSEAKTITRIIGIAASSGFMLWMEGDELQAADCSAVMIHDAASSRQGKLNQMKSSIEASSAQFNAALAKAKDKGIISDEEYETVKDGVDLYIPSSTLRARGVV